MADPKPDEIDGLQVVGEIVRVWKADDGSIRGEALFRDGNTEEVVIRAAPPREEPDPEDQQDPLDLESALGDPWNAEPVPWDGPPVDQP